MQVSTSAFYAWAKTPEDTDKKIQMTGAELMKGIDIEIPASPGSLLISYKKE